MQQPAGLAPLVRSPHTWPHIDGTLEHTSSSFRHRIFRTLMHRLYIDPNRYRTPGERTQSSPLARLRRSGTVQDIGYKAGCSPSSWPDLRSGTQRGIERTSASTANTPQYIARPFDLKSSSDPPSLSNSLYSCPLDSNLQRDLAMLARPRWYRANSHLVVLYDRTTPLNVTKRYMETSERRPSQIGAAIGL
jgi:hypothetical protein